MPTITIKQGETKTLKFTVTSDGEAVDLTDATLTFAIKTLKTDTEYILEKENADFDRSSSSDGIVKVSLSSEDTDREAGRYYGEFQTAFEAGDIDKSDDIIIMIEKAVIE